jgi:hypothetical protein
MRPQSVRLRKRWSAEQREIERRPAAFLPNDPSYATKGRLRLCQLGDAAFVENGALDPF